MNLQLLYSEISQPQYADMTDAEVAAVLNMASMVRRRILISDLQARAMETGVYTALRAAVLSSQTPDNLRAVAQTVLDLAQARFETVDLDNPGSQQMFGALRQSGLISQEQAAAIDALSTVQVPAWSEVHWGGAVTAEDVAAAREWPTAQQAEQERLAAFAALRERLVNGYGVALVWLQAQQDSGQPAPGWDAVVGRM